MGENTILTRTQQLYKDIPINYKKEIWCNVFNNYWVSNLGNVKYFDLITQTEKEVHTNITSTGYRVFYFNRKKHKIHQYVAYSFLGDRPEGLVIDHIDRNKLNNNVNNLRYCTCKENIRNSNRYRIDIKTTDPNERKKIQKKEYKLKNREKINAYERERRLKKKLEKELQEQLCPVISTQTKPIENIKIPSPPIEKDNIILNIENSTIVFQFDKPNQ
jgi:hypothetical protein